MFSWFKRDSAAPTPILSSPWINPVLRAEEVDVLWKKSGSRMVRRVQLTAAGAQFNLHPAELLALVTGRTDIADSWDVAKMAFFVRTGSVWKGTDFYPWTSKLPDDSLVLLLAPMTDPPLAVLSGVDVKSFSAWVEGLARKVAK
ncbi:hypothetical protein [Arthrobacter sp. GMC3]|uniref:hypothetical protein n=1 Tax=Arthrobacter sp. GMC3 TaxID=2058894 RepID=UPI000CE33DBD|nr:hypothetical protein [Arthrobacter sp. GMC3]